MEYKYYTNNKIAANGCIFDTGSHNSYKGSVDWHSNLQVKDCIPEAQCVVWKDSVLRSMEQELYCTCAGSIVNSGYCYGDYHSEYAMCDVSTGPCQCSEDQVCTATQRCHDSVCHDVCTDSHTDDTCSCEDKLCNVGEKCDQGTCVLPDPCQTNGETTHGYVRDYNNIRDGASDYCLCGDQIIPPGHFCYGNYSSPHDKCLYIETIYEYTTLVEKCTAVEECNANNQKIEIIDKFVEKWWMDFIDVRTESRCDGECLSTVCYR